MYGGAPLPLPKVKSLPKILFFTNGPLPTDEEKNLGDKMGMKVVYRNAQAVLENLSPEECDGVFAVNPDIVPTIYRRFPSAETAYLVYTGAISELQVATGDVVAPPVEKKSTRKNWKGQANGD